MEKIWKIEIYKRGLNPEAKTLKKSIVEFGVTGLKELQIVYIYYLLASLSEKDINKITRDFIYDPVSEDYKIKRFEDSKIGKQRQENAVEIIYKPGVMDPTAESVMSALSDLGYKDCSVKTAKQFVFTGNLSNKEIKVIAESLLYNPLIQLLRTTNHEPRTDNRQNRFSPRLLRFTRNDKRGICPCEEQSDKAISNSVNRFSSRLLRFSRNDEGKGRQSDNSEPRTIDILNKSEPELMEISQKRVLALNRQEMLTIQKYYTSLGRNPTDIELETFAQTWSEHCKHKTFSADIILKDGKNEQVIKGLLKSYIKKVTQELNKKWCLSVFEDNSGVIEFDNKFGISFKVETHNHPSALEPYGGAATGIGGVIRDCLGTGLGAKPILNTDVFCFAPPNLLKKKIPQGVLHPKRIIKGVVSGVRDYGNRMGIPTASGAVYFDERYVANPLVYCGTVGIIPRTKIRKKIIPGDLIVLIGGRTGRDGIHGVTFASLQLSGESKQISSGAVQIGNPIEEKKVTDLLLEARDKNLFNATTDCGGGGLSSAIGELAKCGAVVNLEKVPLKYAGLSYTEIWISEAQERMILFVPKNKLRQFLSLAQMHSVEASVIGKVTNSSKLQLKYFGKEVGNINLRFLHNGLPKRTLNAEFTENTEKISATSALFTVKKQNYNKKILKLLSSYNTASKEWVIRQYDFEVQGHSAIKPFVGEKNNGPSDACVVQPIPESEKAVVIGCGLAPQYQKDTYWMAASAIDEAIRNIVAVGGDPAKTALLDNFCWGSPEKPEILADLVRACQACYDIAKIYRTPFISGKDSLYNEYKSVDGENISIPSTLLISAVSIISDLTKTVTMDFKQPNDLIYLIGNTYPEFDSPKVNPRLGKKIFRSLHNTIKAGLVSACHDLSEGGLAIALAEMCFAGQIGAQILLNKKHLLSNISSLAPDPILLFSESNTRFLVSVPKDNKTKFESLMKNLPCTEIGKTTSSDKMKIYGVKGNLIVDLEVKQMEKVWQYALSKALD